MEDWVPTLSAGPLLGIAAAAIALILVLVIVFKLHAFLTLIIVSAATGLAAGIPLEGIVPTMTKGFGSTLASVALLVGLGAMLGRLVETSGGAKSLAETLVARFGEQRAPFALGVASLLMGFPIFFDAGLIVMLPVIFAVARRLNGPVLAYGIPAAGAFSVMHIYLPPHPGPISAAEFYSADIGLVMLLGLIIAIPTWLISGLWLGKTLGRRYPLPVPDILAGGPQATDVKNPATPGLIVSLLLLPMLLIFGNTGMGLATSAGWVDKSSSLVRALQFVGSTPIALLISTLVALYFLGIRRGQPKADLEKLLDGALGPICSVVLITGAGGMFGGVLRTSGIGDALADSMSDLGVPVILGCWLVAAILRLAQGSATVALTTAAALMAPAVAAGGYSEFQIALMVLASAAGSVFAGHVNDSGFWLVGRLMGMDVATTLRTWTLNQALVGAVGFVFVLVFYGVSFAF
ncbi:GntP family permease [Corynebacterium diphtheriae]|uniref:GntP family permease n=1 Tax=Corynebacterium diphtheriae TaxID=1717 RepID=UPI000245BAC6|nr:GntP family permease [Corynebacterium diphtheriae]AEX47730.1 gluconate permease [Corynebacterium diphtheriae BH8]ERA54577.1 gluconate permease [Corynebacterium diphtheriae str. Aberdeen]KLN43359.1 GntP protein [Corynebacterium diphtheriae bv. gravis str. ISS 4746]KLN45315.1 GntP protein [Corynebacterium diphtheriae bv. gravis str. ISS 4749]MBG9253233.1 GntP family permease [Corynebacterium diphtheriae bv. mitis]